MNNKPNAKTKPLIRILAVIIGIIFIIVGIVLLLDKIINDNVGFGSEYHFPIAAVGWGIVLLVLSFKKK